jgi:hypothetical protein
MKKYILIVVACICLGQLKAQNPKVVISEIFFNTPVGGALDSLEFIEIYNDGPGAANINGLRLYSGNTAITSVFNGLPDLPEGAYRIIPREETFLITNLGVDPNVVLPYTLSSNLSNISGTIRLSPSSNFANAIDSLSFQTSYPWYSATGGTNIGSGTGNVGFGHSLERCDVYGSGFEHNSWNFSTNHSGYTRNHAGVFVTTYASPGAANISCANSFNDRYPLYSIADATIANVRGVVDSIGRTMELRGVVHSENFRTTGLAFALIDADHNGIQAFSLTEVNNYVPTLGDSLQVYGTLSFANGLPRLIIDSLFVAAAGQTINSPILVQEPSESSEGKLIQINDVTIDASSWSGSTGGFNATGMNSLGNAITIRIEPGSYYINQPAPAGALSIIGVSSQFQSSSGGVVNYNTDYRIKPRIIGDIDEFVPAAFPLYEISQINGVDGDGIADSLGVACELRAVVHSDNFFNTSGVSFAFIDHTNTGIWVLSNNDVPGFSAVNRGDSLHIKGIVSQHNGMLRFAPDTIIIAGQGNLVNPLLVTDLNENTENKLIKLENLVRIDTTLNTAAGRNLRFLSYSGDTVVVHIVGTIPLINENYFCDTLSITGIGYQHDNNSPYTSGYQVYPRDADDIVELCGVASIEAFPNSNLRIFPNPAQYYLQIKLHEAILERAHIRNTIGQLVWGIDNNLQKQLLTVDLKDFANGTYILQLHTNKGMITRKFTVNN